ncbi:uncharacterized protein LOC126790122 isoform X2 [Argentina anserina]|uniref:uncharacterized protein LOC126790122 isoform X2 n=1 Tax=Argentina anserina TaxID=57926 RepID=UPI0021762260|nr:uncharacterized protein LOC126790122 isoform X2 [Potentilla anserina]
MGELKSEMGDVQIAVGSLETILYDVLPEIVKMADFLKSMRSTVCNLRTEERMSDLVRKVKNVVVEKQNGASIGRCGSPVDESADIGAADGHRGREKVRQQKRCREEFLRSGYGKVTAEHIKLPGSRLIRGINDLSPKTRELMAYLFGRKGSGAEASASHEIGRCGEFFVCRQDLKCLCPEHSINSQIINLMGAMSYANNTDCWFLPTSYSDHATSLGR